MMRPQPVHRGEEQRPPQQQRIERPAPPAAPAPIARPAEPPRPVEIRRPAPAAEVKRPEPRPRNESPVVEQKRGEQRDPRDQQR